MKKVDYNNIAKDFAASRKDLKWEELDYFMDFIKNHNLTLDSVLDVWCGSGRLLSLLVDNNITSNNYLGIDLSSGLLQEAKNQYPEFSFLEKDMRDISSLNKEFGIIFFVASFHHLSEKQERKKVLEDVFSLLQPGGYIFLTNWNLLSGANQQKYKQDVIPWSTQDFSIKFGDTDRYYHGFTLSELEKIFLEVGFSIEENRIFSWERNIVSICKKNV